LPLTRRSLAFGLDRLVAILGGQETIRDFIAFQRITRRDVMIDAPSVIDDAQLKSYIIDWLNQYQCVI
jgi:aspartyl-tRNA synthetase